MNTHKSTDNTRHKGQLDKQWSQNTAQKSKQQAKHNLTKKTNIGLLFPITFTYNNLLYYIWLCFFLSWWIYPEGTEILGQSMINV